MDNELTNPKLIPNIVRKYKNLIIQYSQKIENVEVTLALFIQINHDARLLDKL